MWSTIIPTLLFTVIPASVCSPEDLPCSCYMLGTQESSSGVSICRHDIDISQCKCLPHVIGTKCDQCETGFYNILIGQGCVDCLCDPEGTKTNATCDSKGKCDCKSGYKGYRCDQHLPPPKCMCDHIIAASIENLKQKLSEIETIIQYAPNNSTYSEVYKNELGKLKKKIKSLLDNVQLEQQNVVTNNLPTLIRDTENVKREIENLIARFPISIAVKDVETKVTDIEVLMERCKKKMQLLNQSGNTSGEHNAEILRLLDEAKKLLEQINSLLPFLTQIQETYKSAKDEVDELDKKIKQLKRLSYKTSQRFSADRDKSKQIATKTKKTKEEALRNKELLSNIRFPTINNETNTEDCDIHVPEFEDDQHEEKMRKQFEKTQAEQNKVNKLHQNFTQYDTKSDDAIKANENDVKTMTKIYNDYLDLVEGFYKNLEEIADIIERNNANKAYLKVLQDELAELIRQLEIYLQQLKELDKRNNVNKEFLKKLQDKMHTAAINIEKLKELGEVLDAIPLSPEELDVIEEEIVKAERYYELLAQKDELEAEVKRLKDVVDQLDNLPNATEMCVRCVESEGENRCSPKP